MDFIFWNEWQKIFTFFKIFKFFEMYLYILIYIFWTNELCRQECMNVIILRSYENTFGVQRKKIKILFNNFFSFQSVFATCSGEYHDACVWCCWCKIQRSDVEHASLIVYRLYILVQISKGGQKNSSHPLSESLDILRRLRRVVLCTVCMFFCL